MSDRISVQVKGHVGRLTFDEPLKHNALDQAAWRAIPSALEQLANDGARVIVVSGRGEAFCAGADIGEFDAVRRDADTARTYEQANADAFAALARIPLPTIAAIDGWCLGGGFGLACACDIRLATPQARFGVPAARLGLAYPVEAMSDIVAAIGEQNAKRMLFTAERFDADTLMHWGFLSEIVRADVFDRALEIAGTIAHLAPLTHAATKAAIRAARTGQRDEAERVGALTFTSEDYAEGRAAFREKRKPHFSGR